MRTIEEINKKILSSTANILTAIEAKSFIKEHGIEEFALKVDVVTCASFEMQVNGLIYLSFGQTDPMIYFDEVSINGVLAIPVGPSDLAISLISRSTENINYSGANVLEDIVKNKNLLLKATGKNLDVFQNKQFETWLSKKDINQGKLLLNQAINQNNIVACNSSDKDIDSHMGTLISKLENSTFNSSSFLNPLINDPFCKTMGTGSSVWVAGDNSLITGFGTNHNPNQKRNEYSIPVGPAITLSTISDISKMTAKWVRAGNIKSYGPVLYIGIGVPIPVLDKEIAKYLSITDENIYSTIVDFSIPRRTKPTFGQCSYSELRTSTVNIKDKPTLTAPLSSMSYAIDICNELKEQISNKKFLLADFISPITMDIQPVKLDAKLGDPS